MMAQQDYHGQILHGDVMDKLAEIPDSTFDCIITSPPYWALRNYSVEGQWGLEKTPEEYLSKMADFMAQLKRILKGTGTCWINIGDTYSTTSGGMKAVCNGKTDCSKQGYLGQNIVVDQSKLHVGLKPKSRIGIPERFYINCIDAGWISRNYIPWIKENAMPSSVKDRFTPKWESVFFFAKEQKYYFNLDAVRVKVQDDKRKINYHIPDENAPVQQTLWCNETDYVDDGIVDNTITEKYDKDSNVGRLHRNRNGTKQDETLGADGKPKPTYKGFNDRWKKRKYHEQTISRVASGGTNMETGESLNHPKGKNPGDVLFSNYSNEELLEWINLCRENYRAWEMAPSDLFFINPKPTKENHKATFPVALPQHILKCSCPKEVCIRCGYPKIPITKPTEQYQKYLDSIKYEGTRSLEVGLQDFKKGLKTCNAQYEIVGYDTCECNDEFIPGVVLDPFFGSGTTGIAAELEGLRWCGIELKPEYSEIAKKRLASYVRQECLV